MGTLNDLYLVQRGWFEFPSRPMPELFSFNILFTFVGLPAFVIFYLMVMEKINSWGKIGLTLLTSILLTVLEKTAELYGVLVHILQWNHMYSFSLFTVFLIVNYFFYRWLEKLKNKK
jgi:hypothetical protein